MSFFKKLKTLTELVSAFRGVQLNLAVGKIQLKNDENKKES